MQLLDRYESATTSPEPTTTEFAFPSARCFDPTTPSVLVLYHNALTRSDNGVQQDQIVSYIAIRWLAPTTP
jgi:hypothetical protein